MNIENYKIRLYKRLIDAGYDAHINYNLGEEHGETFPVVDLFATDGENAVLIDILKSERNSQFYLLYKFNRQWHFMKIAKKIAMENFRRVHGIMIFNGRSLTLENKRHIIMESLKIDTKYVIYGDDLTYNAIIDERDLLSTIERILKTDRPLLIPIILYSDMYENFLRRLSNNNVTVIIDGLFDQEGSLNKDSILRIIEENSVTPYEAQLIFNGLKNLYDLGIIGDEIELASLINKLAEVPSEKTVQLFKVLGKYIKNGNKDLLSAINDILELLRFTKDVVITQETLEREFQAIISSYD